MVENFNSRLRPYLGERKEVTAETLSLRQFYLNHKPFMRSYNTYLEGKSAAKVLTGKAYQSELELLEHSPFKRRAA